jgi:hypothetical protein
MNTNSLNRFLDQLNPGQRLFCPSCGFFDTITDEGLRNLRRGADHIIVQDFKYGKSGLVCPECYQVGAHVESSSPNKDKNFSPRVAHRFPNIQHREIQHAGLCYSCTHIRKNGANWVCQHKTIEINDLTEVKSCESHIYKNTSTTNQIDRIDSDLKWRAQEPQDPDMFSRDNSKYFNKIRRR